MPCPPPKVNLRHILDLALRREAWNSLLKSKKMVRIQKLELKDARLRPQRFFVVGFKADLLGQELRGVSGKFQEGAKF
jgi:hypothetical protein